MPENINTDSTDKQPTWTEAESGVSEIYTNLVHLEWTLYDVTLRLAQLKFAGDPRSGTLLAVEKVRATMTWADAKYLRDSLSDLVAKYEKENGEIQRPKLAK